MSLDFIQLEIDFCIYIKEDIIAEVYVDDIKIVDSTMMKCQSVYHELAKHINVEMKGSIKSFLDINVIRNWSQHLIALNQDVYIDRLIVEFELINAHTISTSLDKSLPLLPSIP